MLFQVAVQHLERWAPMSHNPAQPGSVAEVFVFDDAPVTVDLLRLCGCNAANRHMMPQMPKVPCLLDELRRQGFSSTGAVVVHVPGGAKVYDDRTVFAKRACLQCLLPSRG